MGGERVKAREMGEREGYRGLQEENPLPSPVRESGDALGRINFHLYGKISENCKANVRFSDKRINFPR